MLSNLEGSITQSRKARRVGITSGSPVGMLYLGLYFFASIFLPA